VRQVNTNGYGYAEGRNPFLWCDIRADPSAGEIGSVSITFEATHRPYQPELLHTDDSGVNGEGVSTTIPSGWRNAILFAWFISNNTASPGTDPLCDGNAMTQIGSVNSGVASILCAYYKNPPTGLIDINLTAWAGAHETTVIALVELGEFPTHYVDDDTDPVDFAADYDYHSVILEVVASRSNPAEVTSTAWEFQTGDNGNLDFTLYGTYGHDSSSENPGYVNPNNFASQVCILVEALKGDAPLPVMLGTNF
jgi:hypothetical protein